MVVLHPGPNHPLAKDIADRACRFPKGSLDFRPIKAGVVFRFLLELGLGEEWIGIPEEPVFPQILSPLKHMPYQVFMKPHKRGNDMFPEFGLNAFLRVQIGKR
jgi:hypothetical protein